MKQRTSFALFCRTGRPWPPVAGSKCQPALADGEHVGLTRSGWPKQNCSLFFLFNSSTFCAAPRLLTYLPPLLHSFISHSPSPPSLSLSFSLRLSLQQSQCIPLSPLSSFRSRSPRSQVRPTKARSAVDTRVCPAMNPLPAVAPPTLSRTSTRARRSSSTC